MAEIHDRMHRILADLDAIPKTRAVSGGGASYRFRGIDDAMNHLNPLLTKHGVFFHPFLVARDARYTERANSSGNAVEWCRVSVEVDYHFVAAGDGSEVVVRTPGEGMDNSDKATNKAMSAALKYALLQTFCIATEDMEDADRERPDTTHHARPQPQPAPTFRERVNTATGEIDATAQAGGGSAVSTEGISPEPTSTGNPDGRVAAVLTAMARGVPAWAKGDAALAKEAASAALNARPAELNKDVLPEYVAAWLDQPGNSPGVFATRYAGYFDAEQKRREKSERAGAMAG